MTDYKKRIIEMLQKIEKPEFLAFIYGATRRAYIESFSGKKGGVSA